MTTTLSPEAISDLLAGPAGTPPPGVTPNLVNPPNIQFEGRVLQIVGIIIMALPLSLRMYSQWYLARTYAVEDLFVLLAAGCTAAQTYFQYTAVTSHYSSGYHMWDRPLGTFLRTQRFVNYISILYTPAVTLIKVSILIQLRKTFAPTRRTDPKLWVGCWSWIVITPIYYMTEMFLYIFQCSPRRKIWEPYIPGHCIPGSAQLFLASSFFNIISDVLILALPLPAIWRLNMSRKRKFLVGGLFAVASLACVASALRLYYSFVVINDPDLSWNYVALGTAALFEESIGVVVFCLPTMPKLARFLWDRSCSFVTSHLKGSYAGSEQPCPRQPGWPEQGHGDPNRVGTETSLGISSIRQYLGRGKGAVKSSTLRLPTQAEAYKSLPSGHSIEMDAIAQDGSKAHETLQA